MSTREETVKTIKVEVPFALWEAFRKAYPRRGEGTEILRRVISLLVENKERKEIFTAFVTDLAKEEEEEKWTV